MTAAGPQEAPACHLLRPLWTSSAFITGRNSTLRAHRSGALTSSISAMVLSRGGIHKSMHSRAAGPPVPAGSLMVALTAAAGLLASSTAATAGEREVSSAGRAPVIVFPAFHFTKLQVNVTRQFTQPSCPSSGYFEDCDTTSIFNRVCRDRLMTFRYDPNPLKPMAERFSDQPGVKVEIKHYGRTESAPFYAPLYGALERHGYVRDKDIRVAGYDSRRTPDQGGFLRRTIALIEQTYRDNGNKPVHLVGHSNGPLYAQYLLTHTSKSWRSKHIHGFTPLAGARAALRGPLHRAQHQRHRLLVPADRGERPKQRAHVPVTPVDVHERRRPGRLRR